MLVAFPLGVWELALILGIVVVLFGTSKLPQLGSSIGKMLRGFKEEMKAIENDRVPEESVAKRTPVSDAIEVTPAADKATDARGA